MFKPSDGRLTRVQPCVYIIVNEKTDYAYVGSSDKPFLRWAYHVDDASKKKYPLHVAMDRDGLESFSFRVLKQCRTMDEALDEELKAIAACVVLGVRVYNLRNVSEDTNPYIGMLRERGD